MIIREESKVKKYLSDCGKYYSPTKSFKVQQERKFKPTQMEKLFSKENPTKRITKREFNSEIVNRFIKRLANIQKF